jgi:cysteine desulfurase
MQKIYLDNSATTITSDIVIEKCTELYKNVYGNPSSLHFMGLEIEREIRNSRKIIADYIGVNKEEVIFTSGGTEANNIALQGVANAYKRQGNHIITTNAEHPSVKDTVKHLSQNGFDATFLEVDEVGQIDIKKLENSITKETILISIMHVNNETGAVADINKIGEIIKSKNKNIIFHVDGVQAFGKLKINLKNIDMYSMSSHKIHGPKGVGALYVKENVKIKPLYFGGLQEKSLRPGTENSIGIAGFGIATQIAAESIEANYNHVKKIKEVIQKLENKEDKIFINGCKEKDLPYIINISFVGLKSEVVLHSLEENNIYVSSGSACSAKKENKNALSSYGLHQNRVDSAIRFSFSKYTTLEEANTVVNTLNMCLKKLVRM